MGHGPSPWRVARIMQKEVYLCKTQATWNEVGLHLLWEMETCLTHVKKSVAGALFVVCVCLSVANGDARNTTNP